MQDRLQATMHGYSYTLCRVCTEYIQCVLRRSVFGAPTFYVLFTIHNPCFAPPPSVGAVKTRLTYYVHTTVRNKRRRVPSAGNLPV